MEKKMLHSSAKVITEEGQSFRLDYYLTEKLSAEVAPKLKSYGVNIVKCALENNKYSVCDEKTINGIFFDKSFAERFIDILAQNTVTPISVREVAEEFIIGKMAVS